jgi:hypothetical protein
MQVGFWRDVWLPGCDAWPREREISSSSRHDAHSRVADNDAFIEYLARAPVESWELGSSWCRLCGLAVRMGCSTRTDGVYVWPDGLLHYLVHHNVALPDGERSVCHPCVPLPTPPPPAPLSLLSLCDTRDAHTGGAGGQGTGMCPAGDAGRPRLAGGGHVGGPGCAAAARHASSHRRPRAGRDVARWPTKRQGGRCGVAVSRAGPVRRL